MKIPVRNLYLLLSYAWDALEASDFRTVGAEEESPPQDLLAAMLLDSLAVALRRGLHRDYISGVEETELPRGRLLFAPTLARTSLARGRVVAERSELSTDIALNRIAKAAIRRLVKTEGLAAPLRDRLCGMLPGMREVSDVPLTLALIVRTPVHSVNAAYRMVLGAAALIAESTLPQERGDGFLFADFVRDEHRMRRLFQRFVRVFLTREQTLATVVAPAFHWLGLEISSNDGVSIPRLETDVVLVSRNRITVIDTKFTANHFQRRFGTTQSLRSEHLYQLFAYVLNIPRDAGQVVEGVLLYPRGDGAEFDVRWRLPAGEMRAMTVDLSATWTDIRTSLLHLAASAA